VKIRKKLE
jgi:hypothetical protein